MKDTILAHVDPAWRAAPDRPVYREHDLLQPHCNAARAYRDVRGDIRYTCRHDLGLSGDLA